MERLGELLDPSRRGAMRERLDELRPDNGAAEAARWLESLPASTSHAPREGFTTHSVVNPPLDESERQGPPLRARAARARVFVQTLPKTLARLIQQTLSWPRPRTIVLAFGAGEAEILKAIEQAEDPPERVLVVTDSLAIGEVWRLGTGIEHIPGPAEPQAELSNHEYEEFRRRSLGLILAHRPRLRHAVEVGEVPAGLRKAVLARQGRRGRLLTRG